MKYFCKKLRFVIPRNLDTNSPLQRLLSLLLGNILKRQKAKIYNKQLLQLAVLVTPQQFIALQNVILMVQY